jgi:SAM-dependent methyltransferase
MSAAARASNSRRPFQGARQILQYNRRFYVAAAGFILAGLWFLRRADGPDWLRAALTLLVVGAAFWSLASLAASHYVYDRSPLYGFAWLKTLLAREPRRWVNVHAGLDESSEILRRLFAGAGGKILDIYDARAMSEPAIKRARQVTPQLASATAADFRALPLADASCDAVFVIFTAHELREAEARGAFFGELRRVLEPGGSVILVEHLRDAANFIAFGPGVWHFLPRREWLRAALAGGLAVAAEVSVTPFVRAFRLERL